jgi:2-polyprenyl-6-methoxyphenol hydroxylase-like FAD-dependent oxidoreductase
VARWTRTESHIRELEDTVPTVPSGPSADVIVVGAGPTGLMLACELALAGVRCRVLERRSDQPNITRAFAVHARTLELLDARGLADDLLPLGFPVREVAPAPGVALNLRELDSRYRMILMVPQSGTERVLQARAESLGVEIVRGAEVVGISQDAGGVTVEIGSQQTGDGTVRTERAGYVVGCDGAHSAVRRLLGVDFVGSQYETHIMLADVRIARPPAEPMFARTHADGMVIVIPFGDGVFRAIVWDRRREDVPLDQPVTLAEMQDAFGRIVGDDFGMKQPQWSTRFLSERRQARRYRVGRVFLAGDAAHVHSPLGGQGMNTGIQDAMNLGWKLAAAVHGSARPWLLDSYERERHPVGAKVLALTDRFNRLVLGRTALHRALQRIVIRSIARVGPARRAMTGRLSGIGIAYPRMSRDDHRWVGRRMPDVDCGGTRLYELLREGRFVLVTTAGLSAAPPGVVHAMHAVPTLPAAVLVRPDDYVAWASGRPPAAAQVAEAVDRWSGQPSPRSIR